MSLVEGAAVFGVGLVLFLGKKASTGFVTSGEKLDDAVLCRLVHDVWLYGPPRVVPIVLPRRLGLDSSPDVPECGGTSNFGSGITFAVLGISGLGDDGGGAIASGRETTATATPEGRRCVSI